MTKKISKRSFVASVGVVGAAAGGGMVLPASDALGMGGIPNPDPAHLKSKHQGNGCRAPTYLTIGTGAGHRLI